MGFLAGQGQGPVHLDNRTVKIKKEKVKPRKKAASAAAERASARECLWHDATAELFHQAASY